MPIAGRHKQHAAAAFVYFLQKETNLWVYMFLVNNSETID